MKNLFCIYLLLLVMSSLHGAHPALKRLQYGPDWVYQPILINGEEIYVQAGRSSEVFQDRYTAIKQVLAAYDRPFTVLDLGANNGYFSLKIAEEFDAVCVMVDRSERLGDICTLNTERNRIIYLDKSFNKEDIRELARREHFDVVLAFHVLHHVDDWKAWLDALFMMGNDVIIETPSVNDPINKLARTKQIARYLTSLPQGVQIGSFPRGDDFDHMLWFSQKGKWKGRLGILPSTFLRLSGSYPKKSYIGEINKRHGTDKWILQGIDYALE